MIRFILASQSPRRRELLSLAGYPFRVVAADADEESIDNPDPAQNSVQTACLKAEAIVAQQPETHGDRVVIVAADTTVALGERMLGKPRDAQEARQMLTELRGREHQVHTGMALVDVANDDKVEAVHSAIVTMRPYSEREIAEYIASGDPMDKAGAYGIQHRSFQPVRALNGCFLSVMGFSVCQFSLVLRQLNIPLQVDFDALYDAHRGFPCPLLAKIAPSE